MTVTVFTNPSNPQCEATEQELAKLGVRYDTVDLTKNPSTFEQIKNAGFKQIPVVISPNSSWSGHRPDLIRQLAQSFAASARRSRRAPSPQRQCGHRSHAAVHGATNSGRTIHVLPQSFAI